MASAPVISAAAIRRGMLRYDSRAGAGPMHTSSSAKRTWSDSRSASEYTATVCTPSSRQARMTRSAISPRLAISTLLNITREAGCRQREVRSGKRLLGQIGLEILHAIEDLCWPAFRVSLLASRLPSPASRVPHRSSRDLALKARPRSVARTRNALNAKCELRRARRVEHGALVGDLPARVQLHER